MKTETLYHGSNVTVSVPRILINGHYKDFGYGFYCTKLEKQAKRWALAKRGATVINCYQYTQNNKLNIQTFGQMTEEWLQFIVNSRRGIEHPYDIVEGPMADDQIWDYVEDYTEGSISKTAFWELVKFKHQTHQIVFCTAAALETMQFKESIKL